MRLPFLSGIILSLITITAYSQQTSPLESQLDAVFSSYDDADRPGAAVAILQAGAVVFKKGYGSANLEYDFPIKTHTQFHVASISKQFTAFSILLLAEDSQLNLSDDVRKYIPELPDFGPTITLHHLLSHTSGLRDQWNLLLMKGGAT